MSALKGGGAAKEADGFEGRWTVYKLFDLLDESASEIELEPPGTPAGFEFSLRREGAREWHQVKYQNAAQGKWTLAELKNRKVLAYFKSKLDSEPDARCLFFSCDSAVPLRLLWERSLRSQTFERFKQHFLKSYEGDFDDLREAWDEVGEEEAWRLLQRVSTRNMDDASLRQSNRDRARSLIDADNPDAVVRMMTELIGERIHQTLDAADVWQALDDEGWGPREWRADAAVLEAVRATTAEFLGYRESLLINKGFTAIGEVERVIETLAAPTPSAPVVVHGPAGCGKSTALIKVIQHFVVSGWRVLTLDLATVGAVRSAAALGEALGLPAAPTDVLGNIAKEKRALLIIDGLDRITTSPPELTSVLSEVLSTVRSHERISVLLSCRTVELENDDRVKSAISRFEQEEERVELGRWVETSVHAALVAAGIDPNELGVDQLTLLQIPQNLYLLVESRDAGPFNFETEDDLQARFTSYKEIGP